ncbi:SRPBCC family protein [Kribbella sp. NPDC051770]|uniref:SRPBCC family protein n=1 Tax=Kribbella sp. NPDC051770 TaxID=3155413 RepID=UPI00343A6AA6
MPTNITISRSIAIDATPAEVFAFVADPHNLPHWAPRAVDTVEPAGGTWLFRSGDTERHVIVRTSQEHGTVDLISPEGPGVYTRVIPNGTGAEYQFTLFFPEGSSQDAVEAQSTVIEEELETVRTLCEA